MNDSPLNKQQPLRVAAIGLRGIPSNYSGLETSAEGLYRELANRGHEITVFCRARYLEWTGPTYHGIRLVRLPALPGKACETLSHAMASMVYAILRRHCYDLIHFHALAPGILAGYRRMCRTPLVATIQGIDWQRVKWQGMGSRLLRTAERNLVRFSDEIVVVSHDLKHYFKHEYGRDVHRIPNGIEPVHTNLVHSNKLSRFGLQPHRYVVYIGRLVPEKRVEDVIHAFRSIATDRQLAIVGEGGYTHPYVRYLHELADGDGRIVFTGKLIGESLHAVFQNAEVFVQPSSMEGLPMSLLECMAHCVPAIVSDIPPHRELLGSIQGYDLFYTPGDVRSLIDRLRQVFDCHEVYQKIAGAAREYALNNYRWLNIATATERVFYRAAFRRSTQNISGKVSKETS